MEHKCLCHLEYQITSMFDLLNVEETLQLPVLKSVQLRRGVRVGEGKLGFIQWQGEFRRFHVKEQ